MSQISSSPVGPDAQATTQDLMKPIFIVTFHHTPSVLFCKRVYNSINAAASMIDFFITKRNHFKVFAELSCWPKTKKQLKCPSTGKYINYVYSYNKRNKLLIHTREMNFKIFILSKRCQTHTPSKKKKAKHIYSMISFIKIFRKYT